jgi:hypothetical protein
MLLLRIEKDTEKAVCHAAFNALDMCMACACDVTRASDPPARLAIDAVLQRASSCPCWYAEKDSLAVCLAAELAHDPRIQHQPKDAAAAAASFTHQRQAGSHDHDIQLLTSHFTHQSPSISLKL